MFGIESWSTPRKAALAAALLLLLVVPNGISQRSQPVVTGHSTFFNGEGYDPCLASIAGIMKTQVMWFNDQVLVERYGGKGTYVYVTENGSQDPTDPDRVTLWSEGVFYDFVDPNGIAWRVEEAFMIASTNGGAVVYGDPGNPDSISVDDDLGQDREYVWIVELAAFPIHDQFAGDPRSPNYHDLYNFLTIVDTCKFSRTPRTNWDPSRGTDYNVTHEGPDLTQNYGHEVGAAPHSHEAFTASLWVGKKPVIVPLGVDAQGAQWSSDWALADAQGDTADEYPGRPTSPTQELSG